MEEARKMVNLPKEDAIVVNGSKTRITFSKYTSLKGYVDKEDPSAVLLVTICSSQNKTPPIPLLLQVRVSYLLPFSSTSNSTDMWLNSFRLFTAHRTRLSSSTVRSRMRRTQRKRFSIPISRATAKSFTLKPSSQTTSNSTFGTTPTLIQRLTSAERPLRARRCLSQSPFALRLPPTLPRDWGTTSALYNRALATQDSRQRRLLLFHRRRTTTIALPLPPLPTPLPPSWNHRTRYSSIRTTPLSPTPTGTIKHWTKSYPSFSLSYTLEPLRPQRLFVLLQQPLSWRSSLQSCSKGHWPLSVAL